jgi:glutaredoxin
MTGSNSTDRKPHVILYTRPGCHLCEEAKVQMASARCRDEYTFEEINIETEPELLQLYRYEIPMITVDGVKAFKYRLSSADFLKSIRRHTRHT